MDATTTAIQLVAAHRGRSSEHHHAERFHWAMSEAIIAQREIEGREIDGKTRQYWENLLDRMLGIIATEAELMPALWVAAVRASVGAKS